MDNSRRRFIRSSGLVLSCVVGGKTLLLPPAEAFAAQLPLQVLSAAEVDMLHAMAEALVPGATEAGIAHYLDTQLAADADQSLLMLKYLGVPSPHAGFYHSGLANAARLARTHYDKPWSALRAGQRDRLLATIAEDKDPAWQGAPASFFFFVLRADACDVVYGTEAGFERIDMPYMSHIRPAANW